MLSIFDDPLRSFKAVTAALIISRNGGCSAGFLGAAFFALTAGAGAAASDMMRVRVIRECE